MLQSHAIATFNTLVQEGRRVAAALICRTPTTWDDACLYTPEFTESEQDLRLKRALARDYSAAEATKLLTGETLPEDDSKSRSPPPIERKKPSSRVASESELLAVRYGYPGAMPPDISVVDAAAAARAAAAMNEPQSAEEYMDARARKSLRRSATARNEDEKK